ncbi:MAG: hypothetical protein M1838_000261 [Thelocarpon superellum]|nr:MAG: hypothetical protein M1838_000261 [Thelocarpon superellum]
MATPAARPSRSGRKSLLPPPAIDATQARDRAAGRITPRTSVANDALAAAVKETPYASLRQLAGLIQKPSTPLQPSSVGPPSSRGPTRRTPSAALRTPGTAGTRVGKRPAPTTPHALRALQQRRAAALTPGRDRRRSGRLQRETPREALRQLSKILAPNTQPVQPSPDLLDTSPEKLPIRYDDDFDAEPDLPAPELSMPIDEEDEDSYQPAPPELSAIFDENNYTQQSVEVPRRAVNEFAEGRLARGSFGSIRFSDRFAELSGLDAAFPPSEEGGDSMVRPDEAGLEEDMDEISGAGEHTRDLPRALLDQGPETPTDLDPAPPEGDDETTFLFNVPNASRDAALSSPPPPPMEELDDEGGHDPLVDDRAETDGRRDIAGAPSSTRRPKAQKALKLSRHGIPYPSLPIGVVKKMASTFVQAQGKARSNLNTETMAAMMQATDWFFEQVSDDLGTFARHAGRKTIDESDMITLMKRQRQVTATATPFSLAQRYLPRELLQDLRMPVPIVSRRKETLSTVPEEEDESMQ